MAGLRIPILSRKADERPREALCGKIHIEHITKNNFEAVSVPSSDSFLPGEMYLFNKDDEPYLAKYDPAIQTYCNLNTVDLPEELLLTHIIFNLKDILDNCAEIINIEVSKINKKEDIQTLFEY